MKQLISSIILCITVSICFTQPANDDCSNALIITELDGSCMTYDNTGATADLQSLPCNQGSHRNVWFRFEAQHPSVRISVNSAVGDAEIQLVYFDPEFCDEFSLYYIHCNFGPDPVLEIPAILETGKNYWIVVSFSNDGEGEFELCVEEIPCYDNNSCDDIAEKGNTNDFGEINTLFYDCDILQIGPFHCLEGCNLFADPEPGLTPCLGENSPAVWYRFTTDANVHTVNIHLFSDDFEDPTLQLFQQTGKNVCELTGPIGLTKDVYSCILGSGGEIKANSTGVLPLTTYYIIVGAHESDGGNFQLCINALEEFASCVTSSSIEITHREFPGPASGPFYPGETIRVCLNVENFQVSLGDQGCQWFQGIVPVFGNGWSPASFDSEGQPGNATLNGFPFPRSNIYNAGVFDWWTDVHYHHANCFFNVGDFDGNGTLDMCNTLFDPNCSGPGFQEGGCCGPCWEDDPGNPLPPGWFTSGVNGSCNDFNGWPGVDWGDGNTCDGGTGPWNFCFDLMVRDFPECSVDNTTMDLSLGFIAFADGETGAWAGGPSVCAEDTPDFVRFSFCCTQSPETTTLDPVCSGEMIQITLDEEGIETWEWEVQMENATGGTGGSSKNPADIMGIFQNNSHDVGTVTYFISGKGSNECPETLRTIQFIVHPVINIELEGFRACYLSDSLYELTAMLEGTLDPDDYQFQWNTTDIGQSIYVSVSDPGATYCVTVIDINGCFNTACVTPEIYDIVEFDILPPSPGLCMGDTIVPLTAIVGGDTNDIEFAWELPDGSAAFGPSILGSAPGWYFLTVTDAEGCSGMDSVDVVEYPVPQASLDATGTMICPGQTEVLMAAIASGGTPPYLYHWQVPPGIMPTFNIAVASITGAYSVTVTDANGCTAESETVEIEAYNLPVVDLGPDTIYSQAPVILDAGNPGSSYFWNTGDTSQTLLVESSGTYSVTVMDIFGCTGSDTIYLDLSTASLWLGNQSHIKLYPNPMNGTGILEVIPSGPTSLEFAIYNNLGQEIYSAGPEKIFSNTRKLIHLSHVSPGIYFIEIKMEEKHYHGHLLIAK